jgi:hypothetical protein
MVNASTAKPTAKEVDFCQYVNTVFNCNIKKRTANVWLHILGFSYKLGNSQEIYNDGHQREDVKAALITYVAEMQELAHSTIKWTGANMDRQVVGRRLVEQTAVRQSGVISYHDECCIHASDCVKRRWATAGKGGKMSDKSKGAPRMVAAYISDAVGLWWKV